MSNPLRLHNPFASTIRLRLFFAHVTSIAIWSDVSGLTICTINLLFGFQHPLSPELPILALLN
jgi:hypothetical protein